MDEAAKNNNPQRFHIHAAKPATDTTAKKSFTSNCYSHFDVQQMFQSRNYTLSQIEMTCAIQNSVKLIQYDNKILNKNSGTFGLY
jgi:hypothetical protein